MAAEYIALAPQTVAVGANVIWENTACHSNSCAIIHRDESGIITLNGKGKYRITFGANVSSATAATTSVLAISIDGEAIPYTAMASISDAANDIGNIGRVILLDVPCYCCAKVGIRNIGAQAAIIEDANIIIEKVG